MSDNLAARAGNALARGVNAFHSGARNVLGDTGADIATATVFGPLGAGAAATIRARDAAAAPDDDDDDDDDHHHHDDDDDDEPNVKVYLLFKEIGDDYYVTTPLVSHWQVVCHFKDINRYVCYELQTDNGDKGGSIDYRISNFRFKGDIYYYYVGECDISKKKMKKKCSNIEINNLQYILGFRDCQTWAALLIEDMGLSVSDVRKLVTHVWVRYATGWRGIADLTSDAAAVRNYLSSHIKKCAGYRSLSP